MAFERGGYADKLGNRYEGRWIVKQLLHLLNEDICSVTIEAIGDDERGVDLIVEQKDGRKQYQQCKARNGSKEAWGIADLKSKGILSTIQFQLDRALNHEYALVTAIPATLFGDICQSARDSNGNPHDYYTKQIQLQGQEPQNTFNNFCKYLNLDTNNPDDLVTAFKYLQNTYITLWADDVNTKKDLFGIAKILVDAEPPIVVACLAEYANNNLRRQLTASDIWTHLEQLKFYPRKLSKDTRIVPEIQKKQIAFEESIEPMLIGEELIARNETQEILKSIDDCEIIIVHGKAGTGKSGVLYELALELKKTGNPLLPIRLDRQTPQNSAKQYGKTMDLPESPVHCLNSLISEKTGVLILDQLDALRWTSEHSTNSLDVCKEMTKEVIQFRKGGRKISVVLSCRTFDLENDPEIKQWIEGIGDNTKCRKIEIKHLPEKDVDCIVGKTGCNYCRFH